MEYNPYQSPNTVSEQLSAQRFSVLRLVFFVVNFLIATLWMILCAISIAVEMLVGGGSPFAFLGALCTFIPAFAFAASEWLLFVRNRHSLQQPLGITCGLVGALAVFGFAANLFETIVEGGSPGILFWLVFGLISAAVAAYGFGCCWHRLRQPRPPTKDVVG